MMTRLIRYWYEIISLNEERHLVWPLCKASVQGLLLGNVHFE